MRPRQIELKKKLKQKAFTTTHAWKLVTKFLTCSATFKTFSEFSTTSKSKETFFVGGNNDTSLTASNVFSAIQFLCINELNMDIFF